MKRVYLDHAAATQVDERVLAAMQPYFSDKFFNPSATYLAAKAVRQDIEAARLKVAEILNVRHVGLTFTAGGTEANNIAIHGIMRRFPGKKMLVSAIEHESVLVPAHEYPCQEIPVDAEGVVDVEALTRLIDDDTVLVSIMYANNEVGTIQPLRQVAAVIQSVLFGRSQRGIKLPLYFHTDAAQAANYLDLHISRLGVSMMTLNGGKIYGPKQSGALWVRPGMTLEPFIHGGGQEQGARSGTENVPGIIGFSKALEITQAIRQDESRRLAQSQQLFFDQLTARVPGVIVNGSRKKRLPNNVHITIPGQDNERLLMQLDEAGIQAAAGSACSASNEEPSHVLKAMGISDTGAQSSLRFTMGRSTTEQDLRYTVDVLGKIITSN